ncbi:hypothetical protein WAB17_09710 [Parerythrobacter aurantius]|uniref:hypothetical protein n=1 Tax=Parerythrobacter aurantius TaxID=3127706 RepID=UPI0032530F38
MRTVIILAPLLMLIGCDLTGEVSRDPVAAVTSPDGATRAVLFETNGGATTSYGYEIELEPASQDGEVAAAGQLLGAARSQCSWGVNLRWLSPTELAIDFKEAERTEIPKRVEVGAKSVTITERSGISDKAAPCGGMLANLG